MSLCRVCRYSGKSVKNVKVNLFISLNVRDGIKPERTLYNIRYNNIMLLRRQNYIIVRVYCTVQREIHMS